MDITPRFMDITPPKDFNYLKYIPKDSFFIYYDGKEERKIYVYELPEYRIDKGILVGAISSQPTPQLLGLHLSTMKYKSIILPIPAVLGKESLKKRLSKVKVVFTDKENEEKIRGIIEEEGIEADVKLFDGKEGEWGEVDGHPEEPALLIYTSGSSGEPKGVLHGHKIYYARAKIFEYLCFPLSKDFIWNLSDWGWMAGMFYGPFPGLLLKVPFLMFRPKKYDPEEVIWILERKNITILFATPSHFRIMRKEDIKPKKKLSLRKILVAGEHLEENLFMWIEENFGVPPTEFYSQTEAGPIIGNSHYFFKPKPSSMGKIIPGVKAKLGEKGEILVKFPSEVTLLRYEDREVETHDGFFSTGDTAFVDDEGYFYFTGRIDNIVKISGYRVSLEEIEKVIKNDFGITSLAKAVEDEERGQAIKIIIEEEIPKEKIIEKVKEKIGHHIRIKEVEVGEIPKTISGKIIRK